MLNPQLLNHMQRFENGNVESTEMHTDQQTDQTSKIIRMPNLALMSCQLKDFRISATVVCVGAVLSAASSRGFFCTSMDSKWTLFHAFQNNPILCFGAGVVTTLLLLNVLPYTENMTEKRPLPKDPETARQFEKKNAIENELLSLLGSIGAPILIGSFPKDRILDSSYAEDLLSFARSHCELHRQLQQAMEVIRRTTSIDFGSMSGSTGYYGSVERVERAAVGRWLRADLPVRLTLPWFRSVVYEVLQNHIDRLNELLTNSSGGSSQCQCIQSLEKGRGPNHKNAGVIVVSLLSSMTTDASNAVSEVLSQLIGGPPHDAQILVKFVTMETKRATIYLESVTRTFGIEDATGLVDAKDLQSLVHLNILREHVDSLQLSIRACGENLLKNESRDACSYTEHASTEWWKKLLVFSNHINNTVQSIHALKETNKTSTGDVHREILPEIEIGATSRDINDDTVFGDYNQGPSRIAETAQDSKTLIFSAIATRRERAKRKCQQGGVDSYPHSTTQHCMIEELQRRLNSMPQVEERNANPTNGGTTPPDVTVDDTEDSQLNQEQHSNSFNETNLDDGAFLNELKSSLLVSLPKGAETSFQYSDTSF